MTTVVVTSAHPPDQQTEIQYSDVKVVGRGSFGVVCKAKLSSTGEYIAIKKVLQNKRYKNRELQVMKSLNHKNVIPLRFYFFSSGEKKDQVYLNLILEYMPATVHHVARHYVKLAKAVPLIYVKLYTFQLFRALSYIHNAGICHRDVKPQNLLVDPETAVLKLCDFGSAKHLVPGERNTSYICSRYYRAPELIFGSENYTNSIDVWSAGTVLAELLLGQPIFPGDSAIDQLVEIIKVLGTPTKDHIQQMNPNYKEQHFPCVKGCAWSRVFPAGTCEKAIDLVSLLLVYAPNERLLPLCACAHSFFDELRNNDSKLPNGRTIPLCTDFSIEEIGSQTKLAAILCTQFADVSYADTLSLTGSSFSQSAPVSLNPSAEPSKQNG